jgi:RimJ/RimL family protein N-acetyltransferase
MPSAIRVDLSPFTTDDFKRLIGWLHSREALFQWSGGAFDFPLDEPQLGRHLAESPKNRRIPFTAVDAGSREPLGHIELTELDRAQGSVYLVRVLVDPDRRANGIGEAMVRKALEMAFGYLRLHRVSLRVFESNAAAIACYEKVRFTTEGVLRHAGRLNGRYHNALVMSMLSEEWRAGATDPDGERGR